MNKRTRIRIQNKLKRKIYKYPLDVYFYKNSNTQFGVILSLKEYPKFKVGLNLSNKNMNLSVYDSYLYLRYLNRLDATLNRMPIKYKKNLSRFKHRNYYWEDTFEF